jgi:AraC-like DNA-binding protein
MNAGARMPRTNTRRTLSSSERLVADEIRIRHELPVSGETTERQVAVTFAGAFDFQVASQFSWVDPSRVLYVEEGIDFRDHHRIAGVGHSAIILTPGEGLIDEISHAPDGYFNDRIRGSSLHVQVITQWLRRARDPLAAEELSVELVRATFGEHCRVVANDNRSVRKAKAILREAPDERISLTELAGRVGVSPVYLTQAFKRSEGIPLYRYQTQLRLGRALAALPECDDITDLALQLGFSSHSHFTSVFRSAVGMTPSDYRRGTSRSATS